MVAKPSKTQSGSLEVRLPGQASGYLKVTDATSINRRRLLEIIGAAGAALVPMPAMAEDPIHTFMVLARLAEGVYAVGGHDEMMSPKNQGAICNIGVVIGNDAVAVIDSGGSLFHAEAIISLVAKTTPKPIRYLINTHMHPDHIFGNAAFVKAGATIVGHRNLPAALEARGAFYLQSFKRQLGEELMRGVEIVPPTQTIDRTGTLDLGGRTLDLRAWDAAHTDNDLTVFDSASGTLFGGDLVFMRHLPTLDGSLLGWLRQMDELAAVPAARVVPGHGPVAADWPAALADEKRYFEVLTTELRAAIKKGVPLAEAVKTAGQSERQKWALFDDYNERNATTAYAELEWE